MDNNDEIRKTLKILDDTNTTSLYFRFLENEYEKEQQRLKEVADLIMSINPWLKQQPYGDVFENILKSIISMTKNYNDNFQLVTFILEILTGKIQDQDSSKPVPQINNDIQQMLTAEERKNLERLKNYFLQKKNEDID